MNTRSIAMITIVCFGLTLIAGGCVRHRRARGDNARSAETSSASDAATASSSPVELSINAKDDEGVDLPEKEEIRRKYTLQPGSSVNIRGINGSVKIETADTDTAEVLIVRSAKTREDLKQYRKIMVEQEGNELTIRTENDRKSIFSSIGSIPEGRQRAVLKLPRKVNLEINGASGNVTVGEVQGHVEMHGINGQIKATRVAGETDINGVNGGVDVTFAPLTGNGIEVNGVNGNIELRFEGEVNADLSTWGVNGQINASLPAVENKAEEPMRGRMKARIGAGGTQIRVSGINGNLSLMKAEKAAAAKVAAK